MQVINMKKSLFFLMLILISLAVSPAFALGEGNRNLLLIGVMAISPFILITAKTFNRSNILLLLFMLSIVLFPPLFHPESIRWSTVMYSIMFCLTFMAYVHLLYRKTFTLEMYQKLLKYLIYAYFVVLLIQQFCVLTGLPIFNASNYYPTEPWKLNSLAPEPSLSARILALLMYCYVTVKELLSKANYNFRLEFIKDKWVWLAFFWTMLTMGSGTAFLFIGIMLLKFMRFKNIIALLIMGGAIVYGATAIGVTAFDRVFNVFIATLTLDPNTIMHADHSASLRIVPFIILAKMVDATSIDGWFGHGIDYVSTFLYKLIPGVPEGISGGGQLALWMEYGFISFVLFFIFSFLTSFNKRDYVAIVFWFMLVFMYGLNNQIVWLTIILLYTNKYFEKGLEK